MAKTATPKPKSRRTRAVVIDGQRVNSLGEAAAAAQQLQLKHDRLQEDFQGLKTDHEKMSQELNHKLREALEDPWLIQYLVRDYALALERMGVELNIAHPFVSFRTGGGELTVHVNDIVQNGMRLYIDLCAKLPRCIGDPHPSFNGQRLDLEALAEGKPQRRQPEGFHCFVSLSRPAKGWVREESTHTTPAKVPEK